MPKRIQRAEDDLRPPEPAQPNGGAHADPVVELSPETIEAIVDAVEQRVIEDLERRGLRHNPGVF